jgi:plasmid stabilization system protein ParE
LKVVFSPEAEQDLLSAIDFLEGRSHVAAVRLHANVGEVVDRLAKGDFEGPEHRLRSGAVVRSWPVFPYRIYYQRDENMLQIVRIYHQARRPLVR